MGDWIWTANLPNLTNQTAILKGSGVDMVLNLQETQVAINGALQLTVHGPQKARKVEMKFAVTEWVLYGYNETVTRDNASHTEHRVHTESTTLCPMEMVVWAEPSGVLQPGTYNFPFSFPISQLSPDYCTMSAAPDGDHKARISFVVEANIDVPWWTDKTFRIEALVVPRPLLPPPHMTAPVSATEGFSMTSCYCFCCCPSGVMEATATLGPTAAFAICNGMLGGALTLAVKNKSNINVTQVFYFVEEELQLRLQWPRHSSHVPARNQYSGMTAIAGQTGQLSIPKGAEINLTVAVQYPIQNLHPAGQFQKFSIRHHLVVRFESEGSCAPNHELRIPIFLAGVLATAGGPLPPAPAPQDGGYYPAY